MCPVSREEKLSAPYTHSVHGVFSPPFFSRNLVLRSYSLGRGLDPAVPKFLARRLLPQFLVPSFRRPRLSSDLSSATFAFCRGKYRDPSYLALLPCSEDVFFLRVEGVPLSRCDVRFFLSVVSLAYKPSLLLLLREGDAYPFPFHLSGRSSRSPVFLLLLLAAAFTDQFEQFPSPKRARFPRSRSFFRRYSRDRGPTLIPRFASTPPPSPDN